MELNMEAVARELAVRGISRWGVLRWDETVASTNSALAAASRIGSPIGTVLGSESQTHGRGRLGRSWSSYPGESLTFSALIRPARPILMWPAMAMVTGVAVAEALKRLSVPAVLKWPNDVLLEVEGVEAKVCGVLGERCITPEGPAMVVGVGLNVGRSPTDLPQRAASVGEAHPGVRREQVLVEVLTLLSQCIDQWDVDGAGLAERYGQMCITIGRRVRVELGREIVIGRATGVDGTGNLIVDDGGRTHIFGIADVTHLRDE